MTIDPWRITGQPQIDSYVDRWVERAAHLVNALTVTAAHGRAVTPPASGGERLAAIDACLAAPSRLTPADADHLAEVAAELRDVFGAAGRLHAAAARLNDVLIRHRAVPNLHGDPPVLAFHAPDATLAGAWVADMATALAMVVGVGQGARLGLCQAGNCSRVFFDTTRNASRRFCDLSCQNRAKASAYRARRAARAPS
ncbi:CGNR zinc finger domain-containing protein [Nonomuraea sp. NPDC050783]|uniref:CGNR zinc finger domain-containing protein n=1 Tax=Nonomuraea sp. NPDC050783 TaxID=3154634 RepID=UPI003465DB8A